MHSSRSPLQPEDFLNLSVLHGLVASVRTTSLQRALLLRQPQDLLFDGILDHYPLNRWRYLLRRMILLYNVCR